MSNRISEHGQDELSMPESRTSMQFGKAHTKTKALENRYKFAVKSQDDFINIVQQNLEQIIQYGMFNEEILKDRIIKYQNLLNEKTLEEELQFIQQHIEKIQLFNNLFINLQDKMQHQSEESQNPQEEKEPINMDESLQQIKQRNDKEFVDSQNEFSKDFDSNIDLQNADQFLKKRKNKMQQDKNQFEAFLNQITSMVGKLKVNQPFPKDYDEMKEELIKLKSDKKNQEDKELMKKLDYFLDQLEQQRQQAIEKEKENAIKKQKKDRIIDYSMQFDHLSYSLSYEDQKTPELAKILFRLLKLQDTDYEKIKKLENNQAINSYNHLLNKKLQEMIYGQNSIIGTQICKKIFQGFYNGVNSHFQISLEYLKLVVKILKQFETQEKATKYKDMIKSFLDDRQTNFDKFYDQIKEQSQEFFYDFSMLNEKSEYFLEEVEQNQQKNSELIDSLEKLILYN